MLVSICLYLSPCLDKTAKDTVLYVLIECLFEHIGDEEYAAFEGTSLEQQVPVNVW